jgi:VWFA-related protein
VRADYTRAHMRTQAGALAWTLAGASMLAVINVSGQNPPADQSAQPTFRTEANYVRVDVFPTANGTPVADLRQDEFQVLEDGVPQKIEQFEHVVIRGSLPQETRREPSTVAESRTMVQESRARVFVLFLDTLHVEQAASRTIRQPLVEMIDRLIGPDDLIGVMTPHMSPSDVTFARKTTILEGMLDRLWWGERDALIPSDPVEDQYRFCYPATGVGASTSGIAQQMIDRRREEVTLEALAGLARFLRDVREGRKAIIAITDGWVLFRPDQGLAQVATDGRPPELPPITVDPRNGRLTTKDTTTAGAGARTECERDRQRLAQLDDEFRFNQLLDEANRANASFYPVDPRGAVPFDAPIGPDRPPPLQVDRARLAQRSNVLRTLASATDGAAVVSTNNIGPALTRIVADLSSYYLLGYYSTNAKLDGKFRSISVRVRRAGVQVRARRGYLAAKATDLVTRAAPAPPNSSAAATVAIDAVVGSLAKFARDAPLRVHAAAGWNAGNTAAVWVVGEVAGGEGWKTGGDATVALVRNGAPVSTTRASIPAGARSFRVALTAANPLGPGDYQIRVRARSEGPSGGPFDDVVTFALAASPEPTGALLFRRGPSTANKSVATADSRFRRTERLGLEVLVPPLGQLTGRLLDRTGKPLAIPITLAERDDGDGSTWQTGELALAPLAPGDYVVELSAGSDEKQTRTLIPFRIIP